MKKLSQSHSGLRLRKPNYAAILFGIIWLLIVALPLYYVLVTALKQQNDIYYSHPLWFGKNGPFFGNFRLVVDFGFGNYLQNSIIVSVGAVIPIVLFAAMAAYPITFSKARSVKAARLLFLQGLGVPLQALVIPLYLIVIQLGIYDTLLALILPYIGVFMPISILIISNSMRNIPKELLESMYLDGAGNWRIFWNLIVPLSKPALVTVGIYNAVNTWNGFLLPLVLTQSTSMRVVPLSLWNFNSEFETNVPGIVAAVIMSAIPLIIVYTVMRRQLIAGLTAGIGK